jgi:formate dehydrogenase accessory protein FdhD
MSTTPEALPATHSPVQVRRWRDGHTEPADDVVAEEQPVQLSYQGIPHVVLLATPADLEDLGRGFTLTEAIVGRAEEIRSVELQRPGGTLEVRVDIAPDRFAEVLKRQRNLTGRTGCGVCGAETIEQAIRRPPPVGAGPRVAITELDAVVSELASRQPLNGLTGSVHAAAWVLPGAGIRLVREDVGRHNALDKVIGALLREGTDPAEGYLVVTSRASYEMVQKAATAGVALLAAVSAPTALAIRLAEDCGMTLVGFARRRQHVVYAHARRLSD